jgi:ribosomal protein S18 acetylase RimI-like enzyme
MSKGLIVSQATINDLDPLVVLFNEYRIFYKQQSDTEMGRAFLFDRFVHNESVLFVVKDSEVYQTIGFIQLYPSFSSISMKRSWILNDLYVSEAYRGRGVAQLLIDAAVEFAAQTNAKGLAISTAIDNESAQRIYERNGFRKDDVFFHYYLSLDV